MDSVCLFMSRITPITIRSPVPEKTAEGTMPALTNRSGSMDIKARNIAPTEVNLKLTLLRYFDVFSPGLIP